MNALSSCPLHCQDPKWGLTYQALASFRQDLACCILLLRLDPAKAKAVAQGLKFSSRLAVQIESACKFWHDMHYLTAARPGKAVAMLDEVAPLALYAVFSCSPNTAIREKIELYIDIWKHVTPSINGRDLKARGLPPGPAYKTILERLRSAWLDGEISSQTRSPCFWTTLLSKSNRADSNS